MRRTILTVFILLYSCLDSDAQDLTTFGGEANDYPLLMISSSSGGKYLTGYFNGTVDFYPAGTVLGDTKTSQGYSDSFIAKYGSDGVLEWVKTFGGAESEYCYYIAEDYSGNIVVTCQVSGEFDFDDSNEVPGDTFTAFRLVVLKYTSNGSFIWGKTIVGSSPSYAFGNRIVSDANGEIYLAGYFQGTIDFDPDNPSNGEIVGGNQNPFVAKYGPDGNLLWVKSMPGSGFSHFNALSIDLDGKIYLAGSFSNSIDFDPDHVGSGNLISMGSQDAFLLKMTTDGAFIWVKQMGAPTYVVTGDITFDNDEGLILVGSFVGIDVDFDADQEGPNSLLSSFDGSLDAYAVKYDTSGSMVWAKSFGGSGEEWCYRVQADTNGGFALGGYSSSISFDLDTDNAVAGDHFRNYSDERSFEEWNTDVFVAKFNSNLRLTWMKSIGGPGDEELGGMILDTEGNVNEIAGAFENEVDFRRHEDESGDTRVSVGQTDIFSIKYAPSIDFPALDPTKMLAWSERDHDDKCNVVWGSIEGVGDPHLFDSIIDCYSPIPLALDLTNNNLLWVSSTRLRSSNLSTGESTIVKFNMPNLISIDLDFGKEYLWGASDNRLYRFANLGTGLEEELADISDFYWFDLSRDSRDRKMYLLAIDFSMDLEISNWNVDRPAERQAVYLQDDVNIGTPGFAIDTIEDKLYWIETNPNRIVRADLDGDRTSIETVRSIESGTITALEIDPYERTLYWAQTQPSHRIMSWVIDSTAEPQHLYNAIYWVTDLELTPEKEDLIVHVRTDPSWALPSLDVKGQSANLMPTQGSEQMVAEGCGWFRYVVENKASSFVRFIDNSIDPPRQSNGVEKVDQESWFVMSSSGNWELSQFESPPAGYLACDESSEFNLKVVLSGPYDASTNKMKVDLKDNNLLPFRQAYSDSIFQSTVTSYNGRESSLKVRSNGSYAIIDWIVVELWTDANDATSMVAQRAGLLLEDGQVADPLTGTPGITFPVPTNDFHLVVRHRNSLPIISATPVSPGSTYDFSSAQTQAIGGNAMVQVNTGPDVFAMWGGDGDINQSVTAFDFLNSWLSANGGPPEYQQADFNLDGSSTAFDFLDVWLISNGRTSQVPD